MQAAVAKKQI